MRKIFRPEIKKIAIEDHFNETQNSTIEDHFNETQNSTIEDHFNETQNSTIQDRIELCRGIAALPDLLNVLEAARAYTDNFKQFSENNFENGHKVRELFFELKNAVEEIDEKHGEEV